MKFFKTAKVIVSRVWRHRTTNRTASIYGACPWTGAHGDTEADWEIVTKGFALECVDSRGQMTIQGLQCPPYHADTAEDALRHGLKIADLVTDINGLRHRDANTNETEQYVVGYFYWTIHKNGNAITVAQYLGNDKWYIIGFDREFSTSAFSDLLCIQNQGIGI